jgi:uncharacterized protein (TIGR02246 family)
MNQYLKVVFSLSLVALFCSSTMGGDAEEASLLNTGKSWSQAAAAGDMERVFSYWTDDAVIIPAGMEAVKGKDAIRKFVSVNRSQRGFSLKTEPQQATVSKAGDIGYIVGRYEISMNAPDGSRRMSQGRYLTAWRKDQSGDWKCALEIHSPLTRSPEPEFRMGRPAGGHSGE